MGSGRGSQGRAVRDQQRPWRPARSSVSLPKTLEMERYWRVFDMIPRRHGGFMGHLLPMSGFTLSQTHELCQHPCHHFLTSFLQPRPFGLWMPSLLCKSFHQGHPGLYLTKVCDNAQSSYFPTSQQQLTWLQHCSMIQQPLTLAWLSSSFTGFFSVSVKVLHTVVPRTLTSDLCCTLPLGFGSMVFNTVDMLMTSEFISPAPNL